MPFNVCFPIGKKKKHKTNPWHRWRQTEREEKINKIKYQNGFYDVIL